MKNLILFCFVSTISLSVNADAFKFLKHSCNTEKYADACYKMANIYRKKSENKLSKMYYKKGCELGHTKSCNKRKIPKLVVKSLYKKRSRSIASMNTDIMAATKHIKDQEKRIDAISDHYCQLGSKAACISLKCGMKELKNPECREHLKEGFSNMSKVVNDPMKYLLSNKDYFTNDEFEEYKYDIKRLTNILKKCKMGEECLIDGEKIDASKELMVIGSNVNSLEIIVNSKKCEQKNIDACFSRDLTSLSQEALKKFQDLDV